MNSPSNPQPARRRKPSPGIGDIVVLGSSYAALSFVHPFLSHTIPKVLRTTRSAPRYRVVMVSPSTHVFWNISAPRALAGADAIPPGRRRSKPADRKRTDRSSKMSQNSTQPDTPMQSSVDDDFVPQSGLDRIFWDVRDELEDQYGHLGQFEFVQGHAVAVDFVTRNITVRLVGDNTRKSFPFPLSPSGLDCSINFYALVVATGSSADSPLLSLHGPHELTVNALTSFHSQLRKAESVVIAGGGPSGCEIAGQIALYHNQNRAGLGPSTPSSGSAVKPAQRLNILPSGLKPPQTFSEAVHQTISSLKQKLAAALRFVPTLQKTRPGQYSRKAKKITIISGHDRLLPHLPAKTGIEAERKLRLAGVDILHEVRVDDVIETHDGSHSLVRLSTGTVLDADAYIAATGVRPNTAFLPARLLDADGFVVVDPKTLAVVGAGPLVYAFGDCASYSSMTTLDVYEAAPVVQHNVACELVEAEIRCQYPAEGASKYVADAAVDVLAGYLPPGRLTLLMPLTRWGGVGLVYGVAVPGWLVWAVKGRDYRVGMARRMVDKGKSPYAPQAYLMPAPVPVSQTAPSSQPSR